jgi:hypothetical protein
MVRLLVLLAAVSAAAAQSNMGSIKGYITDATGADKKGVIRQITQGYRPERDVSLLEKLLSEE